MERFIDRIIIFLLTVFVGRMIMTDRYFIVVMYSILSVGFFDFFLLSRTIQKDNMKLSSISEKAAFVMQIITVAAAFIDNELIIVVPIALYGAVIIRNYVAGFIALIAAIAYVGSDAPVSVILYVELLLVVSVYLSIKSSRNEKLKKEVIGFRDESVIKEDALKKKNSELISAKDEEVNLGMLKERNRIAREIHDNVGHMLTRAILQLGALITICKDENLKAGLNNLKETLDTAMNNIRNSVHDLRDESIDIPSAIEEIAMPLKENRNLKLDIDISSDVDKNIKYAIIGVVKEGVSNIIKHSDNENVDITLIEHPVMYQLVIHDYGKMEKHNLTADEIDYSGMGLDNIRARVNGVGGNVLITNKNGFRIFVTIGKRDVLYEDRDS
ncbi:MAG: sensor histidine kinase [Lachnospiraceae bacterium]|nr:sensor histidine kinase [Lachnospiraceae bacterium]